MKKDVRILFIASLSAGLLSSGRAQTTKADPAEPIAVLEKFTVSTRGETRANNTIQMADVALNAPGKTGYQLLDMLPGVNITGTDNYGLYEYGWRIRVRAFNINAIAVALDGIPMGNNAANGGNPVTRFFDSENLSSIVVSQGTG